MTTTVQGLDATIDKLDGLDRPEVFRRPMTEGTAHLQRAIAKYPPQVSRPQPFKSDKQRRYFFAALRRGEIKVPYRRTGTLGRRWTTEVSPDGRRGVVGNNTPYGPLVQGDASQQVRYHAAGGWRRVDHVARIEARRVVAFFEAQYRRYTQG